MKKSSNNSKRTSTSLLFWFVFLIIIAILFLISQNKIVRILKNTDFFTHVFGEEPEFIQNYELPPETEKIAKDTIVLEEKEVLAESSNLIKLAPPTDTVLSENTQQQDVITKSVANETEEPATEKINNNADKENVVKVPTQQASSTQYLYFVYVNADGTVERKQAERLVPKTTTPLSAALKSLLNGASPEEKEKGYMSFIPEGTQLLSVSIKDGTALLNFSEDFSFNQYGVEGYLAQLMQVVYTATSFSTIKDVRFLIEGEQTSYLGNDGIWIGSPLSRKDFK